MSDEFRSKLLWAVEDILKETKKNGECLDAILSKLEECRIENRMAFQALIDGQRVLIERGLNGR